MEATKEALLINQWEDEEEKGGEETDMDGGADEGEEVNDEGTTETDSDEDEL